MLATILILAVFGIVMICLEIVLPGAIIGIIGGGLLLTSLALTFVSPEMQGYGIGAQFAIAVGIIVVSVACIAAWMRYFHKTSVGRRLILGTTVGHGDSSVGTGAGSDKSELQGKMGVAKSDLRPAGTVLIDGNRYEAHSPTGFVPSGSNVRVARVDSDSLVVEIVKPSATTANSDSP